MEVQLEKIKVFFTKFPEYIYLIISLLAFVFLIGFITNKNWAIDPANGNQRIFYQWMSRKAFRAVGIVICIITLIATIMAFIAYPK